MSFEVAMIIIGILSGSIMYSYYIPKWIFKIDIRERAVDYNPGGYNAYVVNKPIGCICILLDALKGFVPVYFFVKLKGIHTPWIIMILLAPILGHAFTPLLKGKGGKAISTTVGAMLGLSEVSCLGVLLLGMAIFFSTVIIIDPFSSRVVGVMIAFNIVMVLFRLGNLWIFISSCLITMLLWYKQYIVKIPEPSVLRMWFNKIDENRS